MNSIVQIASSTAGKIIFKTKEHSPEILLGTGITMGIVSAVMACKATLKATEVKKELVNNLNDIHEAENIETYSEDDKKKDLTIAYTKAVIGYGKLYGPSIMVGCLAITSILTSNNILRKRNVALAAAYTTLDTIFKEYRKRVVSKYGEEIDHEMRYGLEEKEIEETTIDNKGKEKKVKKKVKVGPNELSDYAVYFDKDTSDYWDSNIDYNQSMIEAKEEYINHMLVAKPTKCITLNEVYSMLGLKETKAGMVVGWVYDPNRKDDGDNYIRIIKKKVHRQDPFATDGSYHECFLLDFNVDGNVYELMK